MNLFLSQLLKSSPELEISISTVLYRVGHSIAVSVALILATYLLSSQHRSHKAIKNGQTQAQFQITLLMGLSNLLFLCVGLAGVMLLINNNVIRAFSIVAAIALVRFRIKVDQNNPNASYLFAVLGGMASGLGEIHIAWTMTGIYCGILVLVSMAAAWIRRGDQQIGNASAAPKSSEGGEVSPALEPLSYTSEEITRPATSSIQSYRPKTATLTDLRH